jgi:hypothetical protein
MIAEAITLGFNGAQKAENERKRLAFGKELLAPLERSCNLKLR